jgi:hypothetical protein
MRIKPIGKLIILILVAGGVFGVYRFLSGRGMVPNLAPEAKTKEAKVPKTVNLPDQDPQRGNDDGATATVENVANTDAAPLEGAEPGCLDKPEVRLLTGRGTRTWA